MRLPAPPALLLCCRPCLHRRAAWPSCTPCCLSCLHLTPLLAPHPAACPACARCLTCLQTPLRLPCLHHPAACNPLCLPCLHLPAAYSACFLPALPALPAACPWPQCSQGPGCSHGSDLIPNTLPTAFCAITCQEPHLSHTCSSQSSKLHLLSRGSETKLNGQCQDPASSYQGPGLHTLTCTDYPVESHCLAFTWGVYCVYRILALSRQHYLQRGSLGLSSEQSQGDC